MHSIQSVTIDLIVIGTINVEFLLVAAFMQFTRRWDRFVALAVVLGYSLVIIPLSVLVIVKDGNTQPILAMLLIHAPLYPLIAKYLPRRKVQ